MSDYTIFVRDRAKVFLAGPPLVKMATGEDTDDESLGGASMHATTSGLADFLADDERDAHPAGPAVRTPAQLAQGTARRRAAPAGAAEVRPGGAARHPQRRPAGAVRPARGAGPGARRQRVRRVQARATAPPWSPAGASCTATRSGVLANARGVLFSAEAQKAAQFIQLANAADTPLLFLQNTTGYMVGSEYEQARHHQARRPDDQRGVELDGAAPDAQHGRLLRRRQLRHVRPGVRPAVPVQPGRTPSRR